MSITHDTNTKLETVTPSQAVVERIAALEETDQAELDPLYETIDPEALDTLVETTERSNSSLQIQFTYNDYEVTVTSDGIVSVDENADSER
ncbi:HalOD1 output domain-containing protein [Haloprofundus salilacus]|uniref:HalOD1 output domain-containing protein n=1 Tax=Haloprofundus salilacus TaxID=2876190 RepID=UPI001CCDC9A8|nr:HalOD1 output domain-containing protein [Haloprofundus salilacus]